MIIFLNYSQSNKIWENRGTKNLIYLRYRERITTGRGFHGDFFINNKRKIYLCLDMK